MGLIENKAYKLLTKKVTECPQYKIELFDAFVEFIDNLDEINQDDEYNKFETKCNSYSNADTCKAPSEAT